MDQIALIGAIAALALGYAMGSARWLGARPVGDRARALERLLRAGAAAMSARATRLFAVPFLMLAGGLFALQAWLGEPQLGGGRLEAGAWALASLTLGALVSWAGSRLGAFVEARASLRVAAHGISTEEALAIAMRGASVAAVLAAALPLLAISLLFGAALVALGAQDAPVVGARALSGFPLGVALHAAATQTGGAAFWAGAAGAERRLESVEPASSPEDVRNPARLASLVGAGPARAQARIAEAASTASVELVAALLLTSIVVETNRVTLTSAGVAPMSLAALPLLARAYGLLASVVGTLAARVEDREPASEALSRGHWVAASLQLAGFAATSWLLLRPWWAWLSTAAAMGAAAGYGLVVLAQYAEDARYAPARAVADAISAGWLRGVLVGASMGLRAAVAPALLAIALLAIGHLSGEMTGLAQGGLLGIAVAVVGFSGATPYVQTSDGTSGALTAAASLRHASLGGAAGEHASQGEPAASNAAPHVVIGGVLAALLLVFSIVLESERLRVALGGRAAPSSRALDLAAPSTILAALAGAFLVVWFLGRGLRAVDATRVRIGAEARRLLQWLPRERGEIVYPAEGIADPTGCVDAGTRVAMGEAIDASLVVVAVAASVGAAFRWAHGLGVEAVLTLAWIATLVGAPLSLALDGTAALWGAGRRLISSVRAGDVDRTTWERVERDARSLEEVATALGGPLALAPLSVAKLVAAAALAFLPLFV